MVPPKKPLIQPFPNIKIKIPWNLSLDALQKGEIHNLQVEITTKEEKKRNMKLNKRQLTIKYSNGSS